LYILTARTLPPKGHKFGDYASDVVEIKSKSGKWTLYGDTDAQIVVCGHSHAASILQANLLPDSSLENYPKVAVCYTSNWVDGPPGDQEYWEFAAKMGSGKHVVIVWNGNQHSENFIFQTRPLFTLIGIRDENEKTDDVVIPIPITLIKAYFERITPSFDDLSRLIPLMSGALSITILSGPAPMPRSHIESVIREDKFYSAIANELGLEVDSLSLTRDSLRLRLWEVVTEMLKERAAEFGVTFLEAPKVSRDNAGMLAQEYWGDVTHANSTYGRLLIQELAYLSNGKQIEQ
jgi:hypothetical protein